MWKALFNTMNGWWFEATHFLYNQSVVLHHEFGRVTGIPNADVNKYLLLIWGILVVLGIVLGVSKKVSVYQSADDVFFVFTSILFPAIFFYGLTAMGVKTNTVPFQMARWFGILFEGLLLAALVVNTASANRFSLWRTPIALLTKYTMASVLILNLWSMFFGGKSGSKTDPKAMDNQPMISSSLVGHLLIVGILSVLIYKLIWDPRNEEEVEAEKAKFAKSATGWATTAVTQVVAAKATGKKAA